MSVAARDFARAVSVALPPTLAGVWLALRDDHGSAGAFIVGGAFVLAAVLALRNEIAFARRLRTVSSVLTAYREGDFSIRARAATNAVPLNDVLDELNALGETLRQQRLGELEAWTLLRKVMAEVDVVVLAFDDEGRVKLANDAAASVLGRPAATLLLQRATSLGLDGLLLGNAPRMVKDSKALGARSWELRRGLFRLAGEPHTLLVLSDVSGPLRDQEREAWKRIVRVMGHEINNSLAPIHSISENLGTLLDRSPRPGDWEEDLRSGLSVVAQRAEGLRRFMGEYGKLARLPLPELGAVDVNAWVNRVTLLEQRMRVDVVGGPRAAVQGDADQLDQLLINLLKNAVDASLERSGGVRVAWTVGVRALELRVDDDGPGVPDSANLFVPFFTTKPGGSGIGLVLARQIAEAHGGEVALFTRPDGSGAEALVTLPVHAS